MKHSNWNFRELNQTERAYLYQNHMTRDFPNSELKPLDMLEDLQRLGINSVWGCFDGEQLAGYYVLAHEPGSQMILLDYLAVMPELRDQGCGSVILQELTRRLPENSYLFIESELPQAAKDLEERQLRQRRISFYQRNGAVCSPLTVRLFGVDYAILTIGGAVPPSGKALEEAYLSLYRQMLSEERLRKKVFTYLGHI